MTLKESLILIFHERVEEMFKYSAEIFNEENTEALHKMRVAAMRLKGYLKVFRQIFPTSSFNNKYNKIRNFIKTLGLIRELDVSVEIIEDFLLKNPDPNNKIILLYLSKIIYAGHKCAHGVIIFDYITIEFIVRDINTVTKWIKTYKNMRIYIT